MPAFAVRKTSRLVHAASHLPGGPTVSTTLFWIPRATILFVTPRIWSNGARNAILLNSASGCPEREVSGGSFIANVDEALG